MTVLIAKPTEDMTIEVPEPMYVSTILFYVMIIAFFYFYFFLVKRFTIIQP